MDAFLESVKNFFIEYGAVILESVIIILFGFLAVRILKKILRRALSLSRLDGMVLNLIVKIIGFVLDLLIVIWVLSLFNVSLTGIVVLASAISLAVSLAIQDWLGNFASGLSLAATKPFKVGDYVLIGDTEGYVRQIRFMNTVVDTLDNKKAIIPNKTVFNTQIINFSTNPTRMVELYFCVDYGSDIEQVKKVILSVIERCDKIIPVPAPLVRLYEQAASSLRMRVRVWTPNENYFDTLYFLEEEVLIAFRENGINIPFQQVQLSYRAGVRTPDTGIPFTEKEIRNDASAPSDNTVESSAVASAAGDESVKYDSAYAFKAASQMSLDELADSVTLIDRRQRRNIGKFIDDIVDTAGKSGAKKKTRVKKDGADETISSQAEQAAAKSAGYAKGNKSEETADNAYESVQNSNLEAKDADQTKGSDTAFVKTDDDGEGR